MTYDEIDAFIAREERKLRRNFYRMEFGLIYLVNPAKGMEPYHRQKNVWLWEKTRDIVWHGNLSLQTRNLWLKVRNIYILDPAGEVLPLRQAIRLLDVYQSLQAQLSPTEARPPAARVPDARVTDGRMRSELEAIAARGTREPLPDVGARNGAIGSSCARLEAVLIGAQTAAQERLRYTPGSPKARERHEAPSVEEIEFQIEREAALIAR